MIKKVLAALFLLTIFPFFVEANNGLVPCGPGTEVECNLCHLFELFYNILDFIMKVLVPGAAAIFIVYGGVTMYMASANPQLFETGKGIIIRALTGVAIAYGATVLVGVILSAVGLADWGFEFWNNWFIDFTC